jgi:hypothetical protein
MISMAKTQRQADEAPPPRRNRTQAIGDDAKTVGRQAFVRAGFADSTLILHWTEIVGPEVARMARPLKLVESAAGGVLTLKAEPAASVFLQHESRALCERINSYLGRAAVSRLRFAAGSLLPDDTPPPQRRTAPAEAPPGDPACGFQGPEELKSALLGLARQRVSGDRKD